MSWERSRGLDRKLQAYGFGDCIERGQTRIAIGRQCPIETLSLDSSGFCHFCDAPGLREVAESDQEHTRFVVIFQCGLEVLSGKFGVLAKALNDCFVMCDAG